MSSYNSISRLVRFIPSEGSKPVIGEPVDKQVDVGLSHFNGERVEVELYSGSSILSPGSKTGQKSIVGRILSPLDASEVGTIRCIGLNVSSLQPPGSFH